MRRTAALLILVVLGAPGCGDDGSHAPPATCQPADDTTGVLYEVLDQSELIAAPGAAVPPTTHPLTGTFRLKPFPPGPNVELAFELRAVRLCGGTDVVIESVESGRGALGFFGPPGPIIPGGFDGTVNGGEPMLFDGHGPYHFDANGAVVLDGVVFCAPEIPPLTCDDFPRGSVTGYYLKVFAAPK